MSSPSKDDLARIARRNHDWAVGDYGPDNHFTEHPDTQCSADLDRRVLLDLLRECREAILFGFPDYNAAPLLARLAALRGGSPDAG